MSNQVEQTSLKSDQKPTELPAELLGAANDLRPKGGEVGPIESAKLPAGMPHSGGDAQEFACHIHSYLREYVEFSDKKATFVFAVDAAILIYMYQQGLQQTWLKHFQLWLASDLFVFVSMLLLFLGAVACGMVILPRFKSSHRGFVFFGSIGEFESASDYSSTIFKQPRLDLTDALLKHNFDLAKICARKFQMLSYGIWLSVGGVLISIAVLVLAVEGRA